MSLPTSSSTPTAIQLNQTLALSNTLLQASLALGTLEWRIFTAMLARTPRQATDFKEVAIPVQELFPRLSGRATGAEYEQLATACARLASRVVELYQVNGPAELENRGTQRDFQKIPLLSSVSRRGRTGKVYARFNEWLQPYLLGLTHDFTQAPAAELAHLRSAHAHGIYWLLRQHYLQGELTLTVEELKWRLALQNSYKQFAMFERRVVQQAQRELAATALAFTYQVLREPRQAQQLQFRFQPAPLPAAAAVVLVTA